MKCTYCQSYFRHQHPAQKYCSSECRARNNSKGSGPKRWVREVDENPDDQSDHVIFRQIFPEFYAVARPQGVAYKRRKCLKCRKVKSMSIGNRLCPGCNRANSQLRSFRPSE